MVVLFTLHKCTLVTNFSTALKRVAVSCVSIAVLFYHAACSFFRINFKLLVNRFICSGIDRHIISNLLIMRYVCYLLMLLILIIQNDVLNKNWVLATWDKHILNKFCSLTSPLAYFTSYTNFMSLWQHVSSDLKHKKIYFLYFLD